VYKMVPT